VFYSLNFFREHHLRKTSFGFLVSGREGEPEVGIDGWDEMEDAYAFRYTGNGQPDLLNLVTVKCMTMGDSLMVDAVSTDSDNPINLEIK
jgi:proteasome inhibitor subunit 1 (PI31)